MDRSGSSGWTIGERHPWREEDTSNMDEERVLVRDPTCLQNRGHGKGGQVLGKESKVEVETDYDVLSVLFCRWDSVLTAHQEHWAAFKKLYPQTPLPTS